MIHIMDLHDQTIVHFCVQDQHLDVVSVGTQLMHVEGF